MEFDKTRVYTALNADELKQGDKVIVANCMADLKVWAQSNENAREILLIHDDTNLARFEVKGSSGSFISALAYLVERKENCTNCGENCPRAGNININIKENIISTCSKWLPITDKNCMNCGEDCDNAGKAAICCPGWNPKTEQKAENHYRPFKDTDELIKVFCEKTPKIYDKDDEKLFMPYIWVRNKENKRVWLITEFDNRLLDYLFTNCEFLDGSPCGVEE